ncbi:MAG TPA: HAD hydrolase-like protein [Clostridiales bacterium]|nr:HAD hydrolase-like protein [Clostridiales bacterium]
MFNIVIFDMDGTISDSGYGIAKCAQYALRHFGIDVPDLEDLKCFVGPPLIEAFMEGYGLTLEQAMEARELFRQRYVEKGLYENRMYPGVEELIRKLKRQGKTVAVATSKPQVFAEEILKNYGILDCFDQVAGGDLEGKRASKIQIMEEVFRKMGITEEQKAGTVMVGDRVYDVEGAAHFGIACIGVGYGYAQPDELQEAELYAPTVEALSQLLLDN